MRLASVALTSPSVRTVLVAGFPWLKTETDDLEFGHDILPVLAVRSTCTGYEYQGPDDGNDLLVWSDNSIVSHRFLEYTAFELAVCPWDPVEDYARLAPVIARVIEAVKLKVAPTPLKASAA